MLSHKPGDIYPVDLAGDAPTPTPTSVANIHSRILRWVLTIGLIALVLAALFADTLTSGVGKAFLLQRFQTFVTIFLGIFIEAAPFLLAGSLVSGLIEVFLDQSL